MASVTRQFADRWQWVDTPFRFDAESHTYHVEGRGIVPHITGLLERDGLVDDTWYTEESCERGRAVHQLSAEYDLGALDVDDVVDYRVYLLGHIHGMKILQPTWRDIEVPLVHPRHLFGGRPDRVGKIDGAVSVYEVKTGSPTKAHPVQTALQAILVAPIVRLPPESIQRYAGYVTDRGRCKIEHHKNRQDFIRARKILKEYCS